MSKIKFLTIEKVTDYINDSDYRGYIYNEQEKTWLKNWVSHCEWEPAIKEFTTLNQSLVLVKYTTWTLGNRVFAFVERFPKYED